MATEGSTASGSNPKKTRDFKLSDCEIEILKNGKTVRSESGEPVTMTDGHGVFKFENAKVHEFKANKEQRKFRKSFTCFSIIGQKIKIIIILPNEKDKDMTLSTATKNAESDSKAFEKFSKAALLNPIPAGLMEV